jgi:hypothetical protein
MFGIWSAYSQQYLLIFSLSTAILFSLPLFLVPVHWARMMRWTIPEHADLAVYFGRCLGALALVINFIVVQAAIRGEGVAIIFQGLNLLLALMVGVHIYGAVKRIQPITETLEIGFWFALSLLNLCFQPVT